MIRYFWAAFLLLVSVNVSMAQTGGSPVNIQCLTGTSPPWATCSSSTPFPVTNISGGGGGGAVTQGTVPWVVSGQGTAGSAATGVVTVQGIASMTPLLATLSAETTKVIGTVNQGTSPWVVSLASTTITGTAAVTQSGTWTVQPGNTPNSTPWLVTTTPSTSGGLTTFFLQPTASDNHAVIKAGAGQVYYILAMNNSATVNYLRFYNATTGFNGCNSATNLVTQVQIPASTSVGGVSIPLPIGLPFSTGISVCVTSGYATNDTTNATATAMSVTIGYN